LRVMAHVLPLAGGCALHQAPELGTVLPREARFQRAAWQRRVTYRIKSL
jgi:hypothetical protein